MHNDGNSISVWSIITTPSKSSFCLNVTHFQGHESGHIIFEALNIIFICTKILIFVSLFIQFLFFLVQDWLRSKLFHLIWKSWKSCRRFWKSCEDFGKLVKEHTKEVSFINLLIQTETEKRKERDFISAFPKVPKALFLPAIVFGIIVSSLVQVSSYSFTHSNRFWKLRLYF